MQLPVKKSQLKQMNSQKDAAQEILMSARKRNIVAFKTDEENL